MKALLICPARRAATASLEELAPLALAPILGRSLLESWLARCVTLGVKQVVILASDRSEAIAAHVEDGSRWGLQLEVIREAEEMTVADARGKYRAADSTEWLSEPNDVTLLDRLPGAQSSLFESYSAWFSGALAWLPEASTTSRVGIHEIAPGVWAGLRTKISPTAQLRAPCWLGDNVYVGPGAVVGPMAILEDRVFIEGDSEIQHSVIGPDTFVGELTEIHNSIAWGDLLINWKLGSSTKVSDRFLICPLTERPLEFSFSTWFSRLAALAVMAITSPLALSVVLKLKCQRLPAFQRCVAVRPKNAPTAPLPGDTLDYYEMAGTTDWLRRWPQLWNVACGDFAWVGNRPLHPDQAACLNTDSERLWLTAPIGLVTLADTEDASDRFDRAARIHANFYAKKASWRIDCVILARVLLLMFVGTSYLALHHKWAQLFRFIPFKTRNAPSS